VLYCAAAPGVEEFPEALPVKRIVAVTVAVSPTDADAVDELKVKELVKIAPCELGVESMPKPRAAISPSEIRLKNVFVDIYFLS